MSPARSVFQSNVRNAGIRGPVAGKTGTTNDGTDVWFVGYTPTIVASVWFGVDDPEPLGNDASGGRLAAPVWARFLREGWHSPEQDTAWRVPEGIVSATIDVATGRLASDWCGESRREYFREGTAPTDSCESEARIAMLPLPPDAPEPPQPPSMPRMPRDIRIPDMRVEELNRALEEAISAIDNQRGRAAARKVLEELRRAAAEQERARRRRE